MKHLALWFSSLFSNTLTWMPRIFSLLGMAALCYTSVGCGGGTSQPRETTYPVGRSAFDWTDTRRAEKYGPQPGGPRKIVVHLWYPTATGANAVPSRLLTAAQAAVLAEATGLPEATLASLPGQSFADAPVVANGRAFPVLLMSHGNNTPILLYNRTAEYLAARGFIVVGISHTYNAAWTIFSDNTLAPHDPAASPESVSPVLTETSLFAEHDANWRNMDALDADISADIPFVLDRLAELNTAAGAFQGRLRLDQVGIFGHSFGGSHAFRMLLEEPRILAAADIDGTIFNTRFAEGARKPFLVISSARPEEAEYQAAREQWIAAGMSAAEADLLLTRQKSDRVAFENSTSAYYLRLNRAQHGNFTDVGLLAAYGLPQDEISPDADAAALLNTSNEYLAGFFTEKLLGRYAPILHRSTGSADIVFEQRP